MKKNCLLSLLKGEVSDEEAAILRSHQMEHISSSNEAIILELLNAEYSDREDVTDADEIYNKDIEGLRRVTYEYLAEYLPEYPNSWKWIFLSCAYQTFIKKEPMHAKERVHYTEKTVNGEKIYFCPFKSKEADTNCSYCVCHFKKD